MNIRSVLCMGLALGAASLFAEVESSNVFGQIKCTTPYRKTMVAIPWVSTNTTDQTIKVAEIIQTTNLDKGTMALHWNGNNNSWDAWYITGGAWQPMESATVEGVTTTQPADIATLTRGTGIWLIRSDIATNTGAEKTFYLYGRYFKDASGTLTCPANKSTIVCAPYAKADGYNLNSIDAATWKMFGAATGDAIRRQTKTFPYYEEWAFDETNGWGRYEIDKSKRPYTTTHKAVNPVIPAGEAFWYVNRQTSGPVNIQWPADAQ